MKEKNKGISRGKKIILGFLIGLVTIQASFMLLIPQKADAFVFGPGYPTSDILLQNIEWYELVKDETTRVKDGILDALKAGAALAFKNALKVFFGRLAQTTAEWIASGGESQSPLVYFQSWDSFVENAGDAMLGDFLQTMATENGLLDFNLCSPDASFNINLGWGMINAMQPREPECTFSEMYKNWNDTLQDPDFLKQFAVSWGPTQNPLGVSLKAEADLYDKVDAAEQAAIVKRAFGSTYRPVESGVAKYIETPGTMVARQWDSAVDKTTTPVATFTGEILADTVDIFTSTLVSKLMEKMMGGMFSLADLIKEEQEIRGEDIFGSYAGTQSVGQSAAKSHFADITRPSLSEGGSYSILDKLSACPDREEDREYINCSLDSSFRTAIEQQMTVGEALNEGYLNSGFKFSTGGQNSQMEAVDTGYSYRDILILRKYRIVPVGWQLAAEYIRDFSGGDFNLGFLVMASEMCDEDNYSPYCGLVRPDWVLKAPTNFCKKVGFGEDIVVDKPISDGNDFSPDQRLIVRKEQCVDDQSCLIEDDSRNCIAYGYCTEDERFYRLGGNQCDHQNQSCMLFKNESDQKDYAYLMTNLNYSSCDQTNAGCAWYCTSVDVDGNWDCTGPEMDKSINLDGDAKICNEEDAGCTEFISTIDQSNILANGDFEIVEPGQCGCAVDADCSGISVCTAGLCVGNDGACKSSIDCSDTFTCENMKPLDWTVRNNSGAMSVEIEEDTVFAGSKSLKIIGNGSTGDTFYEIFNTKRSLANRTFAATFFANTQGNPDCENYRAGIKPYMSTAAYSEILELEIDSSWHMYGISLVTFPDSLSPTFDTVSLAFKTAANCELLIDNVKLEELTPPDSYGASGFSSYRSASDLVYLNGQRLSCQADEVGCELYTPQGEDATYAIPGIITNPAAEICENDFRDPGCSQCLESQVGCDFFEETPLDNNPPNPTIAWRTGKYCSNNQSLSCSADADCSGGVCLPSVSMIPSTGEQCTVQDAGCEEYTNLDALAAGGEGLEYYTNIRQCVEINDPNAEYYYTWEGSDTEGYQLKTYQLKKSNLDGAPCTNLEYTDDINFEPPFACVDGAQNRPIAVCYEEDLETNPDCRQFLDNQGEIYYRLMSRTITVSDDCHAMRNTIDNYIYYAIPAESTTCSSSNVGCREYKGNAGYNVQEILNDDFESGQAWQDASLSNESLQVGGHSMAIGSYVQQYMPQQFTSSIGYTSVDNVENNVSYIVHFWAKGDANSVKAFFHTENPDVTSNQTIYFNDSPLQLSEDWKYYSLGPIVFSDELREVQLDEMFGFVITDDTKTVFIDNVLLRRSDDFYLIKDSFNLCQDYEGCREYKDRASQTYYLKSFESLCGEDVVGCEALINTNNSNYPFEEIWNNENQPPYITDKDDVTVKKDDAEFVVVDKNKTCQADQKGCSKLGQPNVNKSTGVVESFDDVFLINNPDEYDTILCQDHELECKEYKSSEGTFYFRDPGNRTCEYNATSPEDKDFLGVDYAWYKTTDSSELCPVYHDWDVYTQPVGSVCYGGVRPFQSCNYDYDCIGDNNTNPGVCVSYIPYSGNVSGGLCIFDPHYTPGPTEVPSFGICDNHNQCGANEMCTRIMPDDILCYSQVPPVTDCLNIGQFTTRVCGKYTTVPPVIAELCANEINDEAGWVGICPVGESGCTRYLDPTGENLVRNNSFESDAYREYGTSNNYITSNVEIRRGSDNLPDGWGYNVGSGLLGHVGDSTTDEYCKFERIKEDETTTESETHNGLYSMKLTLTEVPPNPSFRNVGCGIFSKNYIILSPSEVTESYTVGAWVKSGNTNKDTKLSVGAQYYPLYDRNGEKVFDDDGNVISTYYLASWDWGKPIAADQEMAPIASAEDGWVLYQGTIGPFEKFHFQDSKEVGIKFVMYAPLFDGSDLGASLIIDDVFINHNDEYDYIDKTVNGTVESSDAQCSIIDPDTLGCVALRDTTRRSQSLNNANLSCNTCTMNHPDDTEDCRGEANPCDTNIIVKVDKDRKCQQWLDCDTYRETTDENDTIRKVCFSLGGCDELGPNGECSSFVPNRQTSKMAPTMFESMPTNNDQLYLIKNLSGYVKVGMIWEEGLLATNMDHKVAAVGFAIPDQMKKIEWKQVNGNWQYSFGGGNWMAWNAGTSSFDPGQRYMVNLAEKIIPGFYPFQEMYEVGMASAGSTDELLEKSDFEGFYCKTGGNPGQFTPCVDHHECDYLDTDEVHVDGICTVSQYIGPSGVWSTSQPLKKIEVLNYSRGYNKYQENLSQNDSSYNAPDSPVDLNNVLSFTGDGVKTILDGMSIINGGLYVVSFDAKFNSTPEYGLDTVKVYLKYYTSEILGHELLGEQYLSLSCRDGSKPGKECLPDKPTNCRYSEADGRIICLFAWGDSSCPNKDIGDGNWEYGYCDAEGNKKLTTDWQKIILGPVQIKIPAGAHTQSTELYIEKTNTSSGEVLLDNVSLKPVLRVADLSQYSSALERTSKDTLYNGDVTDGVISLARSCRSYPTEEALECDYSDGAGYVYRGWKGYCLESDPRNPKQCLMWYPVDIIAAESDLYSKESAGYDGQAPLYYCLAAKGMSPYERGDFSDPSVRGIGDHKNTITRDGVAVRNHSEYKKYKYKPTIAFYDSSNYGETVSPTIEDLNRNASSSTYKLPTNLKVEDIAAAYLVLQGESESPYTVNTLYLDGLGNCGASPNQKDFTLSHENVEECYTETEFVLPGDPLFCMSKDGKDMCTDQDDTAKQWFVKGHSPQKEDKGDDIMMSLNFDSDNNLLGFGFYQHCPKGDPTQTNPGGFRSYNLHVILKDHCTKIAQVVSLDKTNWAWSERTSGGGDPSYKVKDLLYTNDRDYGLFGSLLIPADSIARDPSTWDDKVVPAFLEQADTHILGGDSIIDDDPVPNDGLGAPYQFRATSPYACSGNCFGSSCVGPVNHLGDTCATKAEPDKFCETRYQSDRYYESGTWHAMCYGIDKNIGSSGIKTFTDAKDRLKLLFAKPIKIWNWDGDSYELTSNSTDIWNRDFGTMPLCGDGRGDYEYCGFQPIVISPKVNEVDYDVEIMSGGTVQIAFGSWVDPEQLPLQDICIDWDDGTLFCDPWNANTKDSHVYTHSYTYSGSGVSKEYQPRIILVDNWGWCSGSKEDDHRVVTPEGSIGSVESGHCDSWKNTVNKVIVARELAY